MIRVLVGMDYLTAGGVESQTTALIAGLDKTRFQAQVICFYGKKAGRSLHYLSRLQDAGIPVCLLDTTLSKWGKIAVWSGIVRAAFRFKPHILHTVNYHGGILSGYAKPLLPARTRLVVSVRAENTAKQIRNQRFTWRQTAAVICNGTHLKTQLIEEGGVPEHKITVIPNGLDISAFENPGDALLRDRIAPGASYLLVTLGRINHKKAQHVLVQALGVLKSSGRLPAGVKVLIVGEREEAATQEKIDAAVQRYDLGEVVTQLAQTDRPVDFYHASDFTVIPSLSEGTPNVMLESLAAGRPVIISEGGNKAGVIRQGVNGWVFRTGDADHLAETIETALQSSPDVIKQMRQACRETAMNFDMGLMIERHQDVYERVVNQ